MRPEGHLRVWFNQGLSNVYDALAIIRQADRRRELTLLASHSMPVSPVRIAADESWNEPAGRLPADEYVDWCLRTCAAKEVHLFVPGRGRRAVARRRGELERNGTTVLVAARPEILDLFDHKDRFYADLMGQALPLAEYRAVSTAEELEEAYQSLSQRHARLCIKPASSIFGAGFHLLSGEDDEYERLVSSDTLQVGIEAFRRALTQAQAKGQRPRDLLVMEHLPGPERSIDCLAQEGKLIAAVARVKRDGWQELETAGPAIDLASALTSRYELSGVFNVQTRDARGTPHLLEINPRMSGGILYACLSGIAFPYWAAMLALGLRKPEEVPAPLGGLAVAPVNGAVIITGNQIAGQPDYRQPDYRQPDYRATRDGGAVSPHETSIGVTK